MSEPAGNRETMQRAAQRVESRHQQIHALQTRLQGQMAELDSRWHGRAASAFQGDYRRFDTEFERVKQGLDLIHSSLVESLREQGGRSATPIVGPGR
ncbi:WXG100 family type VII secretion target [Tessaracoccus flavus]|nr:WXG100 family type VII secretion target [Tessaracoccus flavus]SDY84387.1 WXG100 family type VII secretion target [Tessaracoccus flavus]